MVSPPQALPSQRSFLADGLVSTAQTSSRDDEKCPICFDQLEAPVITPCGHVYCSDCARSWFRMNASCPDCRTELHDGEDIPPRWDYSTYDIGPIALGFEIDEAALVTQLGVFNDIMNDEENADFAVPEERKIYVDFDTLLPQAVAAAIWLRPNNPSGDATDTELCHPEWIKVCKILHEFLSTRDEVIQTAEGFRTLLYQEIWDQVVWYSASGRMPEYAWELREEVSFEMDLNMMVDWTVYCAHEEYSSRFPPA